MSREIEQRIVEMQFDNKQFEQGVSTTMSSLDKLKQSLNLSGAAKGLENVGTAAKSINLSGLTSAAETVCVKFSHMQMTIQHQLNQLVDHAIYTGKHMASALTVDPIKTGFAEYETQINAVQTILANTKSKGTNINDVNAALDQLNTYADKTIYNFTEMTRNIGTFTAAGVDLDKSVTSIKGIANLAAVSGSTSQQASTAMYQLSQALSSGTVKLQDWNSVVNAGMGGEVFQNALKRTAENMGKDVDAMIKKYGSFRESLSRGEWLTADVLTETLTQLSGAYTKADLLAKGYTEDQAAEILELAQTAEDAATKVKTFTQLWDTLKESAQSGWTQTWELLIGDFEEAKKVLTSVSDVLGKAIGDSAQRRNDLLSGALDTNWEKMIKNINEAGIASDTFEDKLKSTMKENGLNVDELVKKHGSLEDVFRSGAVSGDILTQTLSDLSGKMIDLSKIERTLKKGLKGDDVKLAQEALKNLGHDLGKTGIDGSFGPKTEAAVKAFQELNGLEVTGVIDDDTLKALEEANKLTTNLTETCRGFVDSITQLGGREKIIEGIKNVFNGLMNVITPIKDAFRDIFPATTVGQVVNIIDRFRALTKVFEEFTKNHYYEIYSTFKGIFSVLDIGWTVIKNLAGGVVKLVGHFTGLGGGILDITSKLGGWLSGLRDTVKETDYFGKIVDDIVGLISSAIDKLKSFGSAIKSAFQSLDFNRFYSVLQGIWGFIVKIGSRIGEIFAPLGQAIGNLFTNGDLSGMLHDGLFAGVLVGVYKFVDNLNGPLGSLKDLFDGISGEDGLLGGLKDTLDSVRGCFEAYQNSLKADILKKIAVAIAILAGSLFVLSSIDGEALDRSLGAITILFADLMGSLFAFTKLNFGGKGLVKGVSAITGLASALLVLSFAMKVMSTMSWDELGRGIVGTTVGLVALVAAVNLLPKQNVTKSAKAIRTLATALVILAAGMKIMASMNGDEMAIALAGVAGGLFALVTAVNLLPKDTGLRTLGMVGLATAMVILGGALKLMATMSWEELGRGLSAMGGALAEIVIAMNLMPKDAALRSMGMIGLATAMVILGAALKSMGGMSWEEIGRGLTVMGGALLELAIALKLMNGTLAGSAALLIAAAALAILTPVLKILGGMSWEEIGRGLVALAGAFAVIGVAGLLLTPLVPTLLALAGAMALFGVATIAIGAGITTIAFGLTALGTGVSVGATALVAALGAIIVGILGLIPAIIDVVGAMVLALCDMLIECAPRIAETILVVLVEVLAALTKYTPQIVTSLMQFVIGVLDAFAANLPQLIVAAVNVIAAFFQGIVDALAGLDTSTLVKGLIGTGIMAGLMYALASVVALIPGAMAGVLGMGAVIAELAIVIAAIGALAQIPGLSWLIDEGGDFLQKIGTAIGQFVGGIVGGIAEGATSTLPQVGTNLSNFMSNVQPFLDGAKAINPSVMNGVKALAETMLLLTGANILEGIAKFVTGEGSLASFGEELGMLGTNLNTFATNLGTFDESKVATVNCAANAIKMLAQAADGIPNEGGWAAKILGDNSLATFGAQLPVLAVNLSAFATLLGAFDDDKVATVNCAANAIKILAQAADSIPNEGGWAAKILGDNSLATFGGHLPALGTNLASFATNLGTFDESKVATVNCAANAIKQLAASADKIPNEGGWAAKILGDNSLATFGSKLPDLGTNLASFATNLGTFDENKVSSIGCAASAVKAFADAAKGIDGQTEVGKVIFGDNGIAAFSGQFGTLGSNLNAFATNLGTFSSTQVNSITSAVSAINAIADLAKADLAGAAANFTTFGDNLNTIATDVQCFCETMPVLASVNLALRGIYAIIDAIDDVATVKINVFASFTDTLVTLGQDGVKSFVTAFSNEDAVEEVKTAATTFVQHFIDAAVLQIDNVEIAFEDLASAGVPPIKGLWKSFHESGAYLVSGFCAGISENTYKAAAQASAMAKAAASAARMELDEHSPSRVGYEIGDFFGIAFVNAIGDNVKSAYNTSISLASAAESGLKGAFDRVGRIINGEVEISPTVTPVIDLTNVRAGANAINGMLGLRPSTEVLTNVGAVTTMMNRRSQNGGADEIVSAIGKLEKALGNVGSTTNIINGLTYADNDGAVNEALGIIVKALLIGGRV